jgi:hypothetical protein
VFQANENYLCRNALFPQRVFIVMEYCARGNLQAVLDNMIGFGFSFDFDVFFFIIVFFMFFLHPAHSEGIYSTHIGVV